MDVSAVEAIVKQRLPEAEMEIEGADCDFTITIVAEQFSGLNTVKRQQMVLAEFSSYLASGELHALTVNAYTLEEWNNKSSGLVQLSL